MRKIGSIVLVLLLSFSLIGMTGCANIQNDATRTKTEGTLTGAGAGAILGAGLSLIFGGGATDALIGGAIGAAVGGLGGYLVGSHIADKKAEYASQEEWLDACIAQAQSVNKEVVEYNKAVAKETRTIKESTAKLVAEYKVGNASKQELAEEAERIAEKEKEIEQNIALLEEEVKSQQTVVADARANKNTSEAAVISKEIEKTKKNIADLKKYQIEMANNSARLAV